MLPSSPKGKYGAQRNAHFLSWETAIKDSEAVVLTFRGHHVPIVLQGRLVNQKNKQWMSTGRVPTLYGLK
jgi:hypothetical protein